MKRLFIVAMILFSLIFPSVASSAVSEEIEFNLSQEPASSSLQRIYGVNMADTVYGLMSLTSYSGFIQDLTENGSRHVMTFAEANIGNNLDAREWIINQFTSLSDGRIEIDVMGDYRNIIGVLPGYLPGDLPGFVITAHYDSQEDSPGANDNGSGMAVLLEIARVMSKYEWPLDIYFCAFNGADALTPLSGSKEFSLVAFNSGWEFLALYNIDSILFQNRYADLDKRVLLAYASDAPYNVGQYWADLAKMSGSIYGYDIVGTIPHESLPIWDASDHYPFYQKLYRNVLCAYESGYMYDYITGTSSDQYTSSRFAYYLGRETAGILASTMAFTMSRAYGERDPIYREGVINPAGARTFRIAITTPTTINVTSRWFGGGASFRLYTPDGTLFASEIYPGASAWESTLALSAEVTDVGLYSLIFENLADVVIGYETEIEYESDVDGNGILDHEEYWLDTELFESDSDSDSLSDAMEIILGTNMNVTDSDLDSLPDGWEYENGFDPLDPNDASDDADSDGLSNAQEYSSGLNPFSSDSDNDALPDLWELENGLDPLVPDAELDPDGDGQTNLQEFEAGTNPQVVETEPLDLSWAILPSGAIALVCVFVYIYRKYS